MNAPSSFATLPRWPLGLTGMSTTRVGFGAWAVGGPDWAAGWGAQDDRESVTAIRHAIEHGINWIDTAAIYGLGHSEEIVRKALRELPADRHPYIFTKCGLLARRRLAVGGVPDPHTRCRRTGSTPERRGIANRYDERELIVGDARRRLGERLGALDHGQGFRIEDGRARTPHNPTA